MTKKDQKTLAGTAIATFDNSEMEEFRREVDRQLKAENEWIAFYLRQFYEHSDA